MEADADPESGSALQRMLFRIMQGCGSGSAFIFPPGSGSAFNLRMENLSKKKQKNAGKLLITASYSIF